MFTENSYMAIPWNSELAYVIQAREAREKEKEKRKESQAFSKLQTYAGVIFVAVWACGAALICKISGRK